MIKRIRGKMSAFWQVMQMPHLLICVGIAWMITNGWSYLALGMGMFFKWKWLSRIGAGYLAFLWLPFTPEKIITYFIAKWLHRKLYQGDEKTLKVLKRLMSKRKEDRTKLKKPHRSVKHRVYRRKIGCSGTGRPNEDEKM